MSEIVGYVPPEFIGTPERVNLEEMAFRADIAVAVTAFARGEIDLPRARQIVADAAGKLL